MSEPTTAPAAGSEVEAKAGAEGEQRVEEFLDGDGSGADLVRGNQQWILPTRKTRGPGQPPFEPTPVQRKTVAMMVAAGIPHEDIVLVLISPRTGKPIDQKTLVLHFEEELRSASTLANARVAQTLFKKATGDGPQSVAAAIFWAKCRMGWKERVVAEVEIKSGVLVAPPEASPEVWIAAQAAINAVKTEPGADES